MSLTNNIKNIILTYVQDKYKEHLHANKILLIKEDQIHDILHDLYESNIKDLKHTIRNNLKDTYKEEYPSGSVENILLDIFQDKELGINKIIDELKLIQSLNYKEIEVPIINNSLNININIADNFVIINSAKPNTHIDNISETINAHKFIYSINNIILNEYKNGEKIDMIKAQIKDQTTVQLGLYYLKKNDN